MTVLAANTALHVAISLIGIGSGLVVLAGFLARRDSRWSTLFLATTAATSLTGYGFPFDHVLPSHIVGAISLVVLALVIYARYGQQLAGVWRKIYVSGSVTALYFNVFVLVVQSFLKVPALKALAPTQSEPPFVVAQLSVLVLFVVLGAIATIRSKQIQFSTARADSALHT